MILKWKNRFSNVVIGQLGAKGFDQLLELATHGDFRKVDMLVKDIYGDRDDDYTSTLGLSPTVIASSFGKAIHHDTKPEG